ncbi:MAG: hypothetical protein ABEL04_04900 [Salinibacter sp.]|uniref:hypothetical protein n=1 Tax=Salinibacter sp. TaxID=2065818 RepID=UPI0035D49624
MKEIQAVLATTHVDRHGEKFARSALQGMAERIESKVVPMGVEHDPRVPPQGRIVDAELREREDGEYELVGVMEQFEEGDRVPFLDREIPIRQWGDDSPCVVYDRTYRTEQDQETINEIADLLGAESQREGKKAYEVLSVLTIAGKFVAGSIAAGFLAKVGADAYGALKSKVKELMDRKAEETEEYLFKFNPVVRINSRPVEVEVVLTNPTDEDIEAFFEEGIWELDEAISKHAREEAVKRVVYEYEDRTVTVNFCVRKDGAPLMPKSPQS